MFEAQVDRCCSPTICERCNGATDLRFGPIFDLTNGQIDICSGSSEADTATARNRHDQPARLIC
jgi:hypothetical protein